MGWAEVRVGGNRIRWRHDGQEHAAADAGYELEAWHERRQEWRAVRSLNAREWFIIGMEAAK